MLVGGPRHRGGHQSKVAAAPGASQPAFEQLRCATGEHACPAGLAAELAVGGFQVGLRVTGAQAYRVDTRGHHRSFREARFESIGQVRLAAGEQLDERVTSKEILSVQGVADSIQRRRPK